MSSSTPFIIGIASPEALLGLPGHQPENQPQVILRTDPDTAEKLLPAVVAAFGSLTHSVRFIRSRHEHDKTRHAYGAFLVNKDEEVLVYIENALIGYDGAGPILSKKLLSSLGVPLSVFENVNNTAKSYEQHYGIRLLVK